MVDFMHEIFIRNHLGDPGLELQHHIKAKAAAQ
jgi:hypothetical protein